ncbi:hypothetical protein OIV83_000873 [Microbotryomycetes sp. JL201]|nr:hypothetical protein OIV83_000873 [Microbotryomycetes sp. JL201]
METEFQAPAEWGLYSAPDPLATPTVPAWPDIGSTSPSKEDLLNGSFYGLFDDSRIGLTSPYLAQSPRASPLRRARSSEAVFVGQAPAPFYATNAAQNPSEGLKIGAVTSMFASGSPPSPKSEESIPNPRDGQPPVGSGQQIRNRRPSQQARATAENPQRAAQAPRPRKRSTNAGAAARSGARESASASLVNGPPGIAFGSPGDLGITIAGPESQPMNQQPSIEDVNQFMNDMSQMLGPEGLAAVSPEVKPARAPPTPAYPRQLPLAPVATGQTYNLNGVILDEEDYALYSQSPTLRYHTHWQQPFGESSRRRSPPPSVAYGQVTSVNRRQSQVGQPSDYIIPGQPLLHPPFERPRSAPASPDIGSAIGSGGFAPYPGTYAPPAFRSVAVQNAMHRRTSSVDTVPRSFPEMAPGGIQHGNAYPVPHLPPPPPSHYHHMSGPQTPPQYNRVPSGYPTPTYTNPRSYEASSPIGPAPTTITPRAGPRRMSSQPDLPKAIRPVTPARRSTNNAPRAGRRSKDGGFSFINFTASDSKKLLNGVAPSGSSKRKREEEAAAALERAAKKAATAAAKGESASEVAAS